MTDPRTAPRPALPRLFTAASALALALAAPAVYAQVRMGVVDIRRAVAESNEGRASLAAVKTRFDTRQTDLDRRAKVAERLKKQLENPAHTPPAQLQKVQREFYERAQELQQIGQQYTEEISEIQNELTKRIITKMQPVLREVGQTDNYQILLDQAAAVYVRSDLDLTDRVIQLYNQRNPISPDAHIELPEPAPRPAAPPGAPTAGPAALPPTAAPGNPPASAPSGDAGAAALPGVFYRRDGGR